MRNIILSLSLALLLSCSDDQTSDCLQDVTVKYSIMLDTLRDGYNSKSTIERELSLGSYLERVRQIEVEKQNELNKCY